MSSSKVNSLQKKCRWLEEKGQWKELSETYQKLGRTLRESRQLSQALNYFILDRDLCIKQQDLSGQILGTLS